MKDDGLSRRAWMKGAAASLLAVTAGRALAGCGSGDVSIRMKRIDGTVVDGVTLVRASIVLTNHTQQPQSVPITYSLTSASGASLGTQSETYPLNAAAVICLCLEIPVFASMGSAAGSTITVTAGEESISSEVGAFNNTALDSCEYTCNF